jgi:glutathione S-transferase
MSSLKPIILYSHKSGPNPWKVAILFQELGIPYETKFLEFGNGPNGVKGPDYLKIVRLIR